MKNPRRPNVDATYEPTGPTSQFLRQQQDWEARDFHAKAALNSLVAKGDAKPFADAPALAPARQIRLENADGTLVATKACDSLRNNSRNHPHQYLLPQKTPIRISELDHFALHNEIIGPILYICIFLNFGPDGWKSWIGSGFSRQRHTATGSLAMSLAASHTT
jgi:hypothetical protein